MRPDQAVRERRTREKTGRSRGWRVGIDPAFSRLANPRLQLYSFIFLLGVCLKYQALNILGVDMFS